MKTLRNALAFPLLLAVAGSALAAGTSSTDTSTSSSTTSSPAQMPAGTPTVGQYLSPVSHRGVETDKVAYHPTTQHTQQKQHRRHPAGMQRHAGAVDASQHVAQ